MPVHSANRLWKLGWGYTSACNMRCGFCYSASVRNGIYEIGFTQAVRFIDNNAGLIESINYGTGECSLRADWFELIRYIRINHPGIRQAITTNGSLAVLERTGSGNSSQWWDYIDEVDISLDFYIPAKHNSLRGNENAFRWALETIKKCREYGRIATIVLLATNETLDNDNLRGIFDIAAKHETFVRINILRPVNKNGSLKPPDYSRVMEAVRWICGTHSVVSVCDPLFKSLLGLGNGNNGSPHSSLRILPDGNITPSTYLVTEQWHMGNISEDARLENIEVADSFKRFIGNTIPVECGNCRLAQCCLGGAYDRRFLYYDTLSERDPYCPARYDEKHPDFYPVKIYNGSKKAPDIHDGYLPTMIFAPEGMN
jgi:radical SAM protein with 4Fe4S-binding SPASM domain